MNPLSLSAALSAQAPEARTGADDARREAELRGVATQFEAVFLAQMMQHAGVGKGAEGFDGGAGEDAFRGQLIAEQAKLMADKGGIGLAEQLFQALARREGLAR
ncbi:MAG: hypothetical protein GW902_06415 [Alphaproteobacteria bacterium]|nr:hypothetical protein [Alphaproteobacteria bacterium]